MIYQQFEQVELGFVLGTKLNQSRHLQERAIGKKRAKGRVSDTNQRMINLILLTHLAILLRYLHIVRNRDRSWLVPRGEKRSEGQSTSRQRGSLILTSFEISRTS